MTSRHDMYALREELELERACIETIVAAVERADARFAGPGDLPDIGPDVDRSPFDGKPFYCALCGLGFGEYLACELPDCKLESEAEALERARSRHD